MRANINTIVSLKDKYLRPKEMGKDTLCTTRGTTALVMVHCGPIALNHLVCVIADMAGS